MAETAKKCFVVMPMSDGGTYDAGHWELVYSELLRPACEAAGFNAVRADSNAHTNIIMTGVLADLFDADMVLCDTSDLRANVFFELGLRQAFNKPVVIVHDEQTERPFDTSLLRDWVYRSSLRADFVRSDQESIAKAISETYKNRGEAQYSLMRLLEIAPAKAPGPAKEGDQIAALTNAVALMGQQMARLEGVVRSIGTTPPWPTSQFIGQPTGATGLLGNPIVHQPPLTLKTLMDIGANSSVASHDSKK